MCRVNKLLRLISGDELKYSGRVSSSCSTRHTPCCSCYKSGYKSWINFVDNQAYIITANYHIFCCNMFVFACPIIANSQCWLFALRTNTGQISVWANIHIYPQISVFALIYPYFPPNSTSGICAVVSKIICQSTRKDDA